MNRCQCGAPIRDTGNYPIRCSCGLVYQGPSVSGKSNAPRQFTRRGVGKELRKMLGCGCASIPFNLWDENGVEWCQENAGQIVETMAAERRIHWSRESLHRMLKKAIDNLRVQVVDLGDVLPPTQNYRCDVVMPYGQASYLFLADAINSILNQSFVDVTLHLIADGLKEDHVGQSYAELPNVHLYRNTDGPTGPYVIYNRIMRFIESDVWANQDSDDIALPHRLWKSLHMIHSEGFDIVGGEMEQFVDYRRSSKRMLGALARRPVHRSGRLLTCSPSGTIINSTMAIRKESYERCNGVAEWLAGADSEFIERAFLAGEKCVALREVVALRRLHDDSLSNGQTGHGTGFREKIQQAVRESIEKQRKQTDHSIGGLSRSKTDTRLVKVSA